MHWLELLWKMLTRWPSSRRLPNANLQLSTKQHHRLPKWQHRYEDHQNMFPNLSWCHCKSSPCCQPTTPDHRVRRSRAKGPSVAALTLLRRCRAAGAYRSPARLHGPDAGCASSSAVLLIKTISYITWTCQRTQNCVQMFEQHVWSEAPKCMVKLSSSWGCSSNILAPESASSDSWLGCTLISSLEVKYANKSISKDFPWTIVHLMYVL